MIRTITKDDTDAILCLNHTIFFDQLIYDRLFIKKYCEQGLGDCVVDSDQIVGYILYGNTYISELKLSGLTIVSIGVLEKYRHKGYGGKMVRYLTNKYPKQDIYLHARTTNPKLYDFYTKLNFQVETVSADYYNLIKDGVEDAYVMKRKSLATLLKESINSKKSKRHKG